MADIPLSNALSSGQRRAVYVLTASNASLPIPSWAQGGKGIVYVTGCGGGGSGNITTASGQRGQGGGAAGYAMYHPMPIPSGVSTLAATIGAAGAAASTSGGSVNGLSGGDTTLVVGSQTLVLAGGLGGGLNAASTYKGLAFIGSTVGVLRNQSQFVGGYVNGGIYPAVQGPFTLVAGLDGGQGANSSGGFGAGAASPFGSFGAALTAGPTADNNGGNAGGYGAGGAGGLRISGTVSSGAGAPGLLILEFVEGF